MLFSKWNLSLILLLGIVSYRRIEGVRLAEEIHEEEESQPAEAFIAFGWKPDPNSPNFVSSTRRLWTLSEGDGYTKMDWNRVHSQLFDQNSLQEISSQIGVNLGVDWATDEVATTPAPEEEEEESNSYSWNYDDDDDDDDEEEAQRSAFAAPLAMLVDNTHRSNLNQHLVIFQSTVAGARVTLDSIDLKPKLRPEVEALIEERSPAAIVDLMGSFYADQMDLGAMIRTCFQQDKSHRDDHRDFVANVSANPISLALRVLSGVESGLTNVFREEASGIGGVHGGAGFRHHGTGNDNRLHVDVRVQGGDSSMWIGGRRDGNNQLTLAATREQWAQSISDHQFPVHMRLRPIWEVVATVNHTKAIAIQRYLQNKWQQDRLELQRLDNRPRPPCHAWAGNISKIFVRGWNQGHLNRWLGQGDGTQTGAFSAAFLYEEDGLPFLFEAADECDTYYLRSTLEPPSGRDRRNTWMGTARWGCEFPSCVHPRNDAMPVKFQSVYPHNDRYTMQNMFPARRNQGSYLSYTEHWQYSCLQGHPTGSVRSGYEAQEAMIVTVSPQTTLF